jgi:diguanylate cyclase (GGDEF)-like protein
MKIVSADKDSKFQGLSIFHDVAKALTSSLDLDTILATIMQKMAAYFDAPSWALIMLDDNSLDPYYAVPVERDFELVNELRLKTGESLATWVLQHDESLVIRDCRADPRVDPSTLHPDIPKGCTVVCVPVHTARRVLGVMQLMNIDPEVYAHNDLFLQTIADYAAIAIENARSVQRIQELSITDDCTRLYNQRHLFTVLDEEVHRSARFGYEFSLLFLDLDHFKEVNDKYGHLVGSKLIGMVGRSLRESLRLIDAAFRYGGDEFAILLPQTSRDSGLFVARRITRVFHHTNWQPEENVSIQLRASIGVATYPHDAVTPSEIVQRADELMYQVKQAGRDNIAVAGAGLVGIGEEGDMASAQRS